MFHTDKKGSGSENLNLLKLFYTGIILRILNIGMQY